jgi:hypothetical protein
MSSIKHSLAYMAIAVVGGSLMEATEAEVFMMFLLMCVYHEVDALRKGK